MVACNSLTIKSLGPLVDYIYFDAKIITTNNYFEAVYFKGYICPSIEQEFICYPQMSIR